MEDEDDARSLSGSTSRSQSPSPSPSPPPSPPPQPVSEASPATQPPYTQPNGRTMEPVTVAAPPQRTLTLALPIQNPRPVPGGGGGGSGGGGGREDCWSEGATSALIDAWGERYLELSRGNLKQKQWQEVADAVSSRDDYTKPPKTDVQCKNRIDTLKKKYKLESSKISPAAGAGSATSSWPFFNRLDLLIGPNHKPVAANPPPPPTTNTKASVAARPSFPQRHRTQHPGQQNQKKRSPSPSSSKSGGLSPDSADSFPPETTNGRKRRAPFSEAEPSALAAGKVVGLRELARAIARFGEVYQRVESSKLQQAIEMEKQRMGFARELDLQRTQFFMKTQMELSQLNHSGSSSSRRRRRKRGTAGGTTSNHNNNNSNSSS